MTAFEVVEAKPYHVGAMIHRMRGEHRGALIRLGITNPHMELRRTFEMSSYRKAWLIDGELSGLGGVSGSLMDSTGWVWLVLSEAACKYPVAILKEAKQRLRHMMQTRTELCASIVTDDATSVRFAERLGFVCEPAGQGMSVARMERN